ncbi:class I SAM-dependent RNA methyltransferase [Kozakia baliensis]|uniref:class I SAM-dependent RNA methyltransferase n=1 Tax=Kozakia baliensis TaxID=153496 RepID=UPI0038D1E993
MPVIDVGIVGLGATGDGLAHSDGETLFVPGAVPGDLVRVHRDTSRIAVLEEILEPSPERVQPVCSLFGQCGGCSTQALPLPALLEWKVSRVEHALTQAGFNNLPAPSAFQVSPLSRRRIDLAARRVPGGVILGLHRRHGDPVDMTECHVIEPALFALLTPLRAVLANLGALTGDADVQVNMLDSGPDIVIATDKNFEAADRAKLAAFAKQQNIPRVSWQPRRKAQPIETVVQQGPVKIHFGNITLSPPPNVFLQATRESEHAIGDAVVKALPALNRRDPIFELYAGCGTLTAPLSTKGRVLAYDGATEAIAALKSGAGGQRIEAIARDLSRQPLLAKDLAKARVIVLDPPHAGAGPQIQPLAESQCKDIIYVSCNPKALEKDAQSLRKAGYDVLSWHVVDQFLWSSEVEAIVAFTKDSKRLARRRS